MIEFRSFISEDVNSAVPLIYVSGPPSFNYVFANQNHKATKFLKHAFVHKGREFSHDNHIAMLVNGKLIVIGSVFSAKKQKPLCLVNLEIFFSFMGLAEFLQNWPQD